MIRKYIFPMVCLLLLTACGGRQSANESADMADAEAMADTDDFGVVKPKADVEYINATTSDMWSFTIDDEDDDEEEDDPRVPLGLAWFRGNGMQGRELYEMRKSATGKGYVLSDDDEPDLSITVYVYPGADSICVTRDGRKAIFKTADSMDYAVNPNDPDYTPERYAIKVGDHGGKWETLESGEMAYVFPSGEYARSQWVKDGDRLYYVDVSGCRMLNNWAHDGFYAGADGAWDKSVHAIYKNVLPRNGAKYVDDGGKALIFMVLTEDDGTIEGSARMIYPPEIGFQADYIVKSFGSSAYRLYNVANEFECWHVVVLDGGATLRVSGAGVTETYSVEN